MPGQRQGYDWMDHWWNSLTPKEREDLMNYIVVVQYFQSPKVRRAIEPFEKSLDRMSRKLEKIYAT